MPMTDAGDPHGPTRRCPSCGSDNQVPRSVLARNGHLNVAVRCGDCGTDWEYVRHVPGPPPDPDSD